MTSVLLVDKKFFQDLVFYYSLFMDACTPVIGIFIGIHNNP